MMNANSTTDVTASLHCGAGIQSARFWARPSTLPPAAAKRGRHRLHATAEDRADQVLDNERHAERRDEHREERGFMPLDRPVDEALHEQAEHRRSDDCSERRDWPRQAKL